MPVYQRADDKARERAVATQLAAEWKIELVEFPPLSPIDWYGMHAQRLVALIEIKCKPKQGHDSYPEVLLDVTKLWNLLFGALAFGAKAFVVFVFSDGISYADATTLVGLPVRVCGRTDRGDPHDQAPCVQIPITRLTRFTTPSA